ncbi:MAG: hypothetical protein WDN46_12790 [Methylocella sp.]
MTKRIVRPADTDLPGVERIVQDPRSLREKIDDWLAEAEGMVPGPGCSESSIRQYVADLMWLRGNLAPANETSVARTPQRLYNDGKNPDLLRQLDRPGVLWGRA